MGGHTRSSERNKYSEGDRQRKMSYSEDQEIVIVGGGICGLATALALHRKGFRSLVIERSDSLRATGAGIGIQWNGWRALDQLGVGTGLRTKSIVLEGARFISLDNGSEQEKPYDRNGETRWLKRIDLLQSLADDLPSGMIRFGCHVVEVKLDPKTSYPILQLRDGSVIKAKVVIGCDGANSVFTEFLGLKNSTLSSRCVLRGFTYYSNGSGLRNEILRVTKNDYALGLIPVNEKLAYWFVTRDWTHQDSRISSDPELMRASALEYVKGFPSEMVQMIENCDPTSLSLLRLRYRSPWDVLMDRFWKGTVAVAGDAMHVMGPFLAQGGAAGLEDAVVLARCLAQELRSVDHTHGMRERVEAAFDRYVKERRMRVFRLSLQSRLVGLLDTRSWLKKFILRIIILVLFGHQFSDTRYDCGRL